MSNESDRGCANCPHPYGPHVLVALETDLVAGKDIPVGGVMLCPQCDCASTWAVDGRPLPEMPAPALLQVIRGELPGGR